MPRVRRTANLLAVVEAQISRMQEALGKLQVEIARLSRMQARSQPQAAGQAALTLREARQAAEREFILDVGERCGWNRTQMARTLRLDRKSLYRRMQTYGMVAAHPAPSGPPPRKAAKPTRSARARRQR